MKQEEVKLWANEVMQKIIKKLDKTAPEIGAVYPHAAKDKKYDAEPASWWTAGFWPGILWTAYNYSKDNKFKEIAQKCEDGLDEVLSSYYKIDHDAGFIWSLSAVAQYKLLGTEVSKKRALMAANILAGRFNLKGNFIRAWNGEGMEGWAIIDCCMNLPILYWASEQLNDPRFKFIAQAHANTAVEHFVRADGSVNHIVSFNPQTGEQIEVLGGQGNAPDSAWSRGTSWALYGLPLSYKYTGDEKYLITAKKVAHFFISALPEDNVAYWDFRVPVTDETPRDTSAAACAACGLLEIASQVPNCEKALYFNAAVRILKALTEKFSNLDNDEKQALLTGATGHVPHNNNINVGLIYADYFYIEAISRLTGKNVMFW